MTPSTVGAVADAVGGRVEPAGTAETTVLGVEVDSRRAGPGDVFVALPGKRADGHDFVAKAFSRGAAAAIVAAGHVPIADGGPLIVVEDVHRALLDLARAERSTLSATVVAITGSTGKTCTKDFTAAVLGSVLRVVKSPASFNNEVGLPLTVLAATQDTEAVVCEMGSRGRGHIRLLCGVARPHVGVVTNVGLAHIELFGSVAGVREAKAELPESLPQGGTAVLFADDPIVRAFGARTAASVSLFGTSADADVRADAISLDRRTGRVGFELSTPSGRHRVRLPVAGEHMVANALAAAAVGHTFGLSPQEIAGGLARAEMSAGRMEVTETAGGLRVIDDAYNANPASMAAALKAARAMAGSGRCIAVLGPMAELGAIATQEHERIGEVVVRLGIDRLIAVGPEAQAIAAGAEREGVESERVLRCDEVWDAIDVVRRVAHPGDVVLVKASRVAGLDRVAAALCEDDGRTDGERRLAASAGEAPA